MSQFLKVVIFYKTDRFHLFYFLYKAMLTGNCKSSVHIIYVMHLLISWNCQNGINKLISCFHVHSWL